MAIRAELPRQYRVLDREDGRRDGGDARRAQRSRVRWRMRPGTEDARGDTQVPSYEEARLVGLRRVIRRGEGREGRSEPDHEPDADDRPDERPRASVHAAHERPQYQRTEARRWGQRQA